MMLRKSACFIISAALTAGALSGCHVQVSTRAGDDPPPPKPAAPAPAPAPAVATPAPAPKPATPPPMAEPPKTPAPEPKPSKVVQKGGALSMPGAIVFDTDKSTLKEGSGSDVVLEDLKQFLTENEKKISVIRIEGHTDNQGTADHNLELSGQRALTIKKWLVAHGIEEGRLIAVGFGQNKPVAPNTTDDGRAQNRRTEFHVAKTFDKHGKPTNYMGADPLGGGKEFK